MSAVDDVVGGTAVRFTTGHRSKKKLFLRGEPLTKKIVSAPSSLDDINKGGTGCPGRLMVKRYKMTAR